MGTAGFPIYSAFRGRPSVTANEMFGDPVELGVCVDGYGDYRPNPDIQERRTSAVAKSDAGVASAITITLLATCWMCLVMCCVLTERIYIRQAQPYLHTALSGPGQLQIRLLGRH
jgi:hypothetical protein